MPRVHVLGSINIDLVASAPRLPRPGETVAGESFATIPGGKGANQAVSAAQLGGATYLHGAVGSDTFGTTLLGFLEERQVDISAVKRQEGTTGTALIGVDHSGENFIIVIPGANGHVGELDAQLMKFLPGDVLLMQDEVPEAANLAASIRARDAGATSILNLAPFRQPAQRLLDNLDFLIVNETEYAELIGEATLLSPADVAGRLATNTGPIDGIVVTVGQAGCYVRKNGVVSHVAGFPVPAVDTTGAGDCFAGAFGAALARGVPTIEAAKYANAAAAISVTRKGAGPAMPTDAETRQFLAER